MYTIVILELTRVKREAWKRFSVCGQRFPAGQTVVRVWLALALLIFGCGLRLAAADQGSPSQGVSAGKPAMSDTTAADREVAAFERNLTNRLRVLTEAPGAAAAKANTSGTVLYGLTILVVAMVLLRVFAPHIGMLLSPGLRTAAGTDDTSMRAAAEDKMLAEFASS